MNGDTNWLGYVSGAHRKHAEHYVVYARRHTRDYPALQAELANLLAAAKWSAKRGNSNNVLALADWLYASGGEFLNLQGRTREALRLLTWALDAARALEDQRQEGRLLGSLGRVWATLASTQQAIDCYEQALVIAREVGDRREEGSQLGNLGLSCWTLGKQHQAVDYFEQALTIAREIGDRQGEGRHLGSLGLAWAALTDTKKAIDCYERALVIAREVGDRQGEESHLGCLGLAWTQTGVAELREVGESQRRSAQMILHRLPPGPQREQACRTALTGDSSFRKATKCYEQALVIAREIGDRRGEGNHLGNLGNTYFHLNKVQKAIECFEQAVTALHEVGDRRNEGFHLGNLGKAYRSIGEVGKARQYWKKAFAIFETIEDARARVIRRWLEETEEDKKLS